MIDKHRKGMFIICVNFNADRKEAANLEGGWGLLHYSIAILYKGLKKLVFRTPNNYSKYPH